MSGQHTDSHKKHHADGSDVNQSKLPLIITGFIIAGLVASYFMFPGFEAAIDEGWEVLSSGDKLRISDWVNQYSFWGPIFIVLAMVAQMFLMVVNVVLLMLVAIIAYGPVWGSLLAIVAVLVASTIGYFIGKGIGEAGVSKLIGSKAERKVSDFMADYGVWAIIIARISPFLSNDAVSFVAGFATMSYWKFILATMAGIVPLTILLAWLGENNERLKSGLIWVSAISITVFIGYIVYQKYIKNK
jgi:uncharacterized membrane protein YdjX (TVP38/TMEM64 family)